MQQRRGSASQWTTANTVLAAGEIGFETDTSKFKIGDGVTEWNDLPYFVNADDIESGLLDTDEVSEGTINLYFTDARAQAAVATDISNAIDAIDTDDIEEGTTNLYFTNQRAIDAVVDNIELDDLSDVNVSEANDGDALVYDTATTSWLPGSVAIDALGDINDVEVEGVEDGQALIYNTSSNSWIPGEAGGKFEVSEAAPEDPEPGDVWFNSLNGKTYLYYQDEDSSQWVEISGAPGPEGPQGPAGPAGSIDVLTDVTITGTPSDSSLLAYDTTSGEWVNKTADEAGVAPRFITETSEKTVNYTIALTDINQVVLMNGTSLTLTIPDNNTVAFPLGSIVNVYNANSTDVTVVGASGVTVRNAGDLAEFGEVSLRKRGTNEWVVAGNLA
jgi:hypothetical protein